MAPKKHGWLVTIGWLLVLLQVVALVAGPGQGRGLTAENSGNIAFVVGFFVPLILGAVFLLLGYIWAPAVQSRELSRADMRSPSAGKPAKGRKRKRKR